MRTCLGSFAIGWTLAAALPVFGEAPAAAPAPAPEPAKVQGLTLTVGETSIRFYGNLRLDMHYDTAHPNNNQLIYVIKSVDPAAPTGIGEPDKQPDFVMHAKLTRFGIDVASAPIASLDNATIGGKLEVDFLAQGGDSSSASASRPIVRLRHAYTRLAWDDLSLTLGQTNDIIAPLAPTVNAEFVMWGAGNVGDRRPQVSADYHPSLGIGTVILQGEVGLTGAQDNQNIDGGSLPDGTASGYPTLQARVAFRGSHPLLEKKTFEVGMWVTWGKEYLDTLPAGYTERRFTSLGSGIDVTLPICPMFDLRGECFLGQDLDDIRGGILQGVSNVSGGREIRSRGYWVEGTLKPLDWYSLHLGTTRDNPYNGDIVYTAASTGATGAVDNHVFYLCNRFNAGGGFTFGLDYLHWITDWRGALHKGVDDRFTFFSQFSF
jgi:hypothetical protein